MDQPYFNDLSSIRSNAKEMSRLYKAICEALSASPQRTELLLDCARAVARGLFQIGDGVPNALDWHTVFAEFTECNLATLDQPHDLPAGAKQHDLASLLAQQPAAFLPAQEQAVCEKIAALAFMQLIYRPNRKLPALFFRGLRKIYTSNSSEWKAIRKEIVFGAQLSLDFVNAQPKGVRQTFVVTVNELQKLGIPEVSHALPTILREAVNQEPSAEVLEEEQTFVAAGPEDPIDLSPNFNLLQLVRRDDDFAPPLDSYRIGFQWDALHPTELKLVLNRLVDLINFSDSENFPLRLAGCAAVVALFARTSFERAMRIPIVRRGTLHLDLRCGLLRRKLSVLAKRTDEEKGPRTCGYWLRTFLPQSVCETLLEAQCRFPLEQSLGQLLAKFDVSEETCLALVNKDCDFIHKPESLRFARSLSSTMLSLNVHPSIVSITTGDTTIVPSAEPYYLCRSQKEIHEAVSAFCQWAGLSAPRPLNKDRLIGSSKMPTKQEMQNALQALSRLVFNERMKVTPRSTVAVRNQFFNLYVVAVTLQFLWSVGSRFACLNTLTYNRVFGFEDAALIHDKQSDDYSQERCVPLSDPIKKTLRHYFEHLRAHASFLAENGHEHCSKRLQGIYEGRRQTLGAFELIEDGPNGALLMRAVELHDVRLLAQKVWPGELNRPRHFYANELVSRGVCQVLIDGFTGRHCRGAEPFGFSSGLATAEYVAALRPVLNEIHAELGLQPISGFGRTAERYLVVPLAPVRPGLSPQKNQFLEQRLQVADLLVPDVSHPAEECPFSSDTLLALSQLRFLRASYLRSTAPAEYPCGALAFTLVVFDGVVAPKDLEKFYEGAVNGLIKNVGGVAMLEVVQSGRVVLQRALSDHTLLAFSLAKKCSLNLSFQYVRKELAQLIAELDATWRVNQSANVLDLLCALASHAMSYEVPPHLQVASHYKAPILLIEDLARICQKQPCKNEHRFESGDSEAHIAARSFKSVMRPLRVWADPENRVGEQQARKAGLRRDLQTLIDSHSLDAAEKLLAEWLISESAQRPLGRRLKIQVLERYAAIALPAFQRIGLEQTFHLDSEVWREILDELEQGQPKRKDRARWVLTHVCDFLNYKGASVPRGLLSRQTDEARAPRNPVYVTLEECQQICQLAKDPQGPFSTSQVGSTRFQLARHIPLRPSEIRYAKLSHISIQAGLLAVTTSGHGHLKGESARGLLPIPPHLFDDVQELHVRRSTLGKISDVPIFAGSSQHGDNYFDADTNALASAARLVTGQGAFRNYDLRSCAITDLIAQPYNLLCMLALPSAEMPPLDSASVNRAYQRVAIAQRFARHRSPFTTLLSYYAAGNIELAVYLRRATANLEPSSGHIAGMCDLTPNAVDKRVSIRAGNDAKNSSRAEILAEMAKEHVERAQKPDLAKSCAVEPLDPIQTSFASQKKILRAGLAVFLGNDPQAVADVLKVPLLTLNAAIQKVSRRKKTLKLGRRSEPRYKLSIFEHETFISRLLEALTEWFATSKSALALLRQGILSTVNKEESCLVVPDQEILQAWLPHLKAMKDAGVQLYFQPRSLHMESAIQDSLIAANILICNRATKCRGYGVIRFGRAASQRQSNSAPHELVSLPSAHLSGRVGRLIIQGFLLAEATQQLNEDGGNAHG